MGQRNAPTSLTLRLQLCAARSYAFATKSQLFTIPRGNPGEAFSGPEGPRWAGLEHSAPYEK